MPLPANWTDGGAAFHASDENAVEAAINAITGITGVVVGNGTSSMVPATGANIVAPSAGHGLSTRETPSGSVNGSNLTFTLAHTPVSGTEVLTYNGLTQTAGGVDYTISGTTITFVIAPLSGVLLCTYWY